jgi:hypothetical protein
MDTDRGGDGSSPHHVFEAPSRPGDEPSPPRTDCKRLAFRGESAIRTARNRRTNEHNMKTNNRISIPSWLIYSALCLSPIWVSCQSRPPLVLQTVGPANSASSLGLGNSGGGGFLKVYSATETRHVGNESKYYPHTDYMIYSTNGSAVRWVENSLGPMDETPAVVELPAGSYNIRAEDDDYGRIIVPVRIEPWRTTKVYLETRANEFARLLSPSNSVFLPNGRIVGWQAN